MRVDAARAVEEVAGEVWGVVGPLVKDGGVEGAVGRLWEGALA